MTKDHVMGNTWEVYAWKEVNTNVKYDYVAVYCGESWLSAIWEAVKAKRSCGCVKVEWR
jgi:hypothetical protein